MTPAAALEKQLELYRQMTVQIQNFWLLSR